MDSPGWVETAVALAAVLTPAVVRGYSGFGFAMPGCSFTLWVGVLCGIYNGAAAIGGPPAIPLYPSSPAAVAISRASIIVYFFGINLVILGVAGYRGQLTPETFSLPGLCLVPLVAGRALGSRIFQRVDPVSFRRNVLLLLAARARAGLLRSLF
jgi:uncharacterized protein